ncbi:GNAT family N-acetyltransferase [Thalassobacillus sp. CUG 92003]|uniref:GNAT family N-acetyltransferase n=1 Tax=Thalassobacillus sp. CUG 92003 TaxID=2736641 RepID=UPI0021055857|nr:GNAT family protein [Thalassobacillus sp. CUG 92003]
MTQREAEEIASWHYPSDYAFYDMEADKEDYEEFIDPALRKHAFSVWGQGGLIGFFSFNPVNDETVDIGLGMRPDLTGKGLGEAFLIEGLAFAAHKLKPAQFTLSVASFNHRAITVYQRAEFSIVATFMQKTNGGEYEFVKMVKEVKND